MSFISSNHQKSDLEISLKSYKPNSAEILVSNKDFHFTEKIIKENIQINNLIFKMTVEIVDNIQTVIRSKYIPKYSKSINTLTKFINFSFDDFIFNLDKLDKNILYRVKIELVEKMMPLYNSSNLDLENIHKKSNQILLNPQYGIIDEIRIKNLNEIKFSKKMISKSEKDVIKNVNNEIEFQELNDILSEKEIKSLIYENRNYKGLDKFINSNSKFSKKMTDERKKKVLFGTNTQIFFEEKIMKNNINPNKNPFLKNEWFMGGIYSYDKNYKKYI